MKRKKTIATFLTFALIIVTIGVSFAFFNYSRTSISMTTIKVGDLLFSFIDGDSVTLTSAYPVSDNIGATDTRGEYKFNVSMDASIDTMNINYNISLVSNNTGSNVFKNNQIKFALIKNNTYVAGTSEIKGIKLSEIKGFNNENTYGDGEVLTDQEITPNQTDYFKLRIWISDDVDYSNEINEDGWMEGKYNNYTYSLKVRINGELSTTSFNNLNISNDGDVSIDVEDKFGLKSYAVKQVNEEPTDEEWINIEEDIAKNEIKIKRISKEIKKTKNIKFKADDTGAYFIFVKNLSNRISRKAIGVTSTKIAVYLDAMGGVIENTSVDIRGEGFYTNLPQPTKPGYVFKGWYTKQTGGELANDLTSYESLKAKTLYARYDKGTYTLTINPNGGTYEDITGNKTEQVEYQNKYTLTEPTRIGYTFDGWDIIGSGSAINKNTLTMGIEDTELKAKWIKNKYNLTINLDNGENNQEYELEYLDEKEIAIPTKDGYTFTGWEVTGTNAVINSNIFKIGESNATIKATWKINNYKYITKHYKQNIIDNYYTLVSADTKENVAEFNTEVTPNVKIYTGFISPSLKTITITSNEENNLVEYNYNREKRILNVNPNGGSYNNQTDPTTYEMKYEETKTIENPTREGYDFTNWANSNGELTDKVFKMGIDNVTLTANWSPKTFTVTFNAGDGTVTPSTKTVIYDSTYGDLPSPIREYYEFEGWYLDVNYTTKITETTIVKIEKSQKLYAKWSKVEAPIISGGSDSTVYDYTTIKIATAGTSVYGIDHYEYYISSNNTKPASTVTATGTTNDSLTIANEGKEYIWYRTVSKQGLKSDWSNSQTINQNMLEVRTYVQNGKSYASVLTANHNSSKIKYGNNSVSLPRNVSDYNIYIAVNGTSSWWNDTNDYNSLLSEYGTITKSGSFPSVQTLKNGNYKLLILNYPYWSWGKDVMPYLEAGINVISIGDDAGLMKDDNIDELEQIGETAEIGMDTGTIVKNNNTILNNSISLFDNRTINDDGRLLAIMNDDVEVLYKEKNSNIFYDAISYYNHNGAKWIHSQYRMDDTSYFIKQMTDFVSDRYTANFEITSTSNHSFTLESSSGLQNKETIKIDATAPQKPIFSNKTITEDSVSLNYSTTESDGEIVKVTCYYGDSSSSLPNKNYGSNGKCTYPSTAAYAKVCVKNKTGFEVCSDVKQLATYFVKDGIELVPLSTANDAIITKGDGNLNVHTNSGNRSGIYTTNTYDFSIYNSLYIDMDYYSYFANSSNPTFELRISDKIWFKENPSHLWCKLLYSISSSTAGDSRKMERSTLFYTLNINDTTPYYITLGKNASTQDLDYNIYNLWMQLKN